MFQMTSYKVGGCLFTSLQSGHKVSSLNGLCNEIWNVGCNLILGGKSNLYMSLNIHSTMENKAPILDVNFGVRPLGKVKLFTFNNISLAHLILHIASYGVVLLFVATLDFQDLFTLLGQVLTILVEL